MKWLARISLDRDEAALLRLFDAYSWHQLAWSAFPGQDGKERTFLTRLDFRDCSFQLLILSSMEPSRPGCCDAGAWSVTPIPESFTSHSLYRFDLVANPTRKVVKLDGNGNPTKNGKRLALLKIEEQKSWLERKASDAGFRVIAEPPVEIDRALANAFVIRGRRVQGTHMGVRYRGVLEVENRERFRQAFRQGIGSAKAFGFGMLVLQPLTKS